MTADDCNRQRIKGMDGLRAIAALGVFCVHFNQVAGLDVVFGPFDLAIFMANGNHGVSLFFSLSGFLLSLPFWAALINNRAYPRLKRYFLRRMARIIPAYYFLLTGLILLGQVWRIPGSGFDIASHYLMCFNITEFTIFSMNPPFWTIAVEAQFYLILPLLFWGIFTVKNRLNIVAVMVVILTASCMFQYFLLVLCNTVIAWPLAPWLTWIRPNGAVLNHSPVAGFPHFFLGVCAGFIFQKYGTVPWVVRWLKNKGEIIFLVSLILVLSFLAVNGFDTIVFAFLPYNFPFVPLCITAMILVCPFTQTVANILEYPALKRLGVISYGLYLYHYPILTTLDHLLMQRGIDATVHWLLFGATGFFISVIAAALSFYLIEKPFLKRVSRV